MARKRKTSHAGRAFLFAVLFLTLGALAIFKAGVFEFPDFTSSPLGPPLAEAISINGPVSVDDLQLSAKEIKRLNRAVRKHRHLFPSVCINLAPNDRLKSLSMEKNTSLVMTMALKTDEDCEVTSWPTKLMRIELVPRMVRFMDKAAFEFTHYRELRKGERIIQKLYI